MMQELKIAGRRRMIFSWRWKQPARLGYWKFFHRMSPVIRFSMMIIPVRINHIGRGSDNEQGNNQKADIGHVFFLFKELW